jgi:hypothetical protein
LVLSEISHSYIANLQSSIAWPISSIVLHGTILFSSLSLLLLNSSVCHSTNNLLTVEATSVVLTCTFSQEILEIIVHRLASISFCHTTIAIGYPDSSKSVIFSQNLASLLSIITLSQSIHTKALKDSHLTGTQFPSIFPIIDSEIPFI